MGTKWMLAAIFVLGACGRGAEQSRESPIAFTEGSSALRNDVPEACNGLTAPSVTPGLYGLCVAYCGARDCADSNPQCEVAGRRVLELYNEQKSDTDPPMPCVDTRSYHWEFVRTACQFFCQNDPAYPECNPLLDGYGPHTCDAPTIGRYIVAGPGIPDATPTNPTVLSPPPNYWFGWVSMYTDASGTWHLYPDLHLEWPWDRCINNVWMGLWQCVYY